MQRARVTPSTAYLFMMAMLLFGLPLLTVYYGVNSTFYFLALIPYFIVAIVVTVVLLLLSRGNYAIPSSVPPHNNRAAAATFIARFNAIPPYAILGLASITVVSFAAMRVLVASAYPYPPPPLAGTIGGIYVALLTITTVIGFSRVVYHFFPALRGILQARKYALMSIILSVTFALVYLLEVNQIVITGYGAADYIPSPSNAYPFAYVFTAGIQQPFINLVYMPYILIQLNSLINLLIVPYEMVFATILSLLVASNVVMAHHLISNSGLKCSTKGATLSTAGSLVGMCATCPTCLVPAFITVLFGGIAAAEAVFSNIYGVVLPPVISVAALLISLVYMSRTIKRRTPILMPGSAIERKSEVLR